MLNAMNELLANTTKSVTGVSRLIGFRYPQHTSLMFKQEAGMTPTQYC